VLVRRDALAQVDGFDPNLKAGEEPEMCSRLRATGWVIEHIDEPMTGHDLAIRTWKAYWLRAKRSGMAYAEIAHKMQKKGDLMWQNEAKRDLVHGSIYLASPLILAALYALSPLIPLIAAVLFFTLLIRTALRSAWKAPTNHMLCMQYAVHVHLQKIPSLFGQLAWRLNHRRGGATQWVDYKNHAPRPNRIKSGMVHAITGLAKLWRGLYIKKWLRVWSLARLQADIGKKVDPSNVLLGPIEIQGTARIYFGCGALIYPDCYLETQGSGSIEIGDNVVLSRGVHIVAFDKVVLSDGVMVGEYTSIRDANHRVGTPNTRSSGHDSAPIHISRNVWIGRGVCVLKGAHIGQNTVVAANATVTQSLPADVIATGTPARVKTDLKA
jgi:acetyltransferase-like isoleucine patch superfamily enzyme